MEILLGTAALVSCVLGYSWALGLSRSPTAPAWARSQVFASAVCLTIVGLAPLGVGYLAYGLLEPLDAASWVGLAALALSLPALWLAVPRLTRRPATATAVVLPMPPTSPAPVDPAFKMAA